MLTDHLGSTSLVADASGNVISEARYTAWGEVRYQAGTMSTGYGFNGQFSDSYIKLLDYGSRRYDPQLGRFIQPDSIVPLASQGVQAYDRYAYTNNNPVKYTDPSGHSVCGLSGNGICTKDEELIAYAEKTVLDYGGKNGLEGMARIVDKAARLHKTYAEMIPALSMIFLGLRESNSITIYTAGTGEALPCAAVGRPECGDLTDGINGSFGDTGFHEYFRDRQSQPYHFWAYVTTVANTELGQEFVSPGGHIAMTGNIYHELLQGDPYASWEDYALGQAGINIGAHIRQNMIAPRDLGDYIRMTLESGGFGAPSVPILNSLFPLNNTRR